MLLCKGIFTASGSPQWSCMLWKYSIRWPDACIYREKSMRTSQTRYLWDHLNSKCVDSSYYIKWSTQNLVVMLYFQIAAAFSTAAIFVIWDITSTFPRLTTCPRKLQIIKWCILRSEKNQTHSNCCLSLFNLRPQWMWISLIVLHVILLLPVLSKVAVYSWDPVRHHCEKIAKSTDLQFLFPTHSSNPTMYLPRFWPSCTSDKALNLITAPLIFHFPSFTSIQCTVTPWNPIFIISADHPSWVMDIFPEATSVSFSSMHFVGKKKIYIYFFIQLLYVLHRLVVKMDLNVVGAWEVQICWFQPHQNERVLECQVISEW